MGHGMGVGQVIEKKAPPMTTPSNFRSRGTINNKSLLIYLITFHRYSNNSAKIDNVQSDNRKFSRRRRVRGR